MKNAPNWGVFIFKSIRKYKLNNVSLHTYFIVDEEHT